MKSQRSFHTPRSSFKAILLLVIAGPLTFVSSRATAANLPSGFTEEQFGGNFSGSPTAMAFAPDRRLFVCQQGGQLRVIKTGSLLSTPFVSLTVDSSGERGLLGHRVRSELRHEQLRLLVLHGFDFAEPQPDQPVYRGGRYRRTGQRGRHPGTRQSQLRHQPQWWRAPITGSKTGATRVALRALGPSLQQFGIANPLPDPWLALSDANGTLLASDDNWQTHPNQAAAMASYGLVPPNNLESAIAISLAPARYTAIVTGKNNQTGIGLIEIRRTVVLLLKLYFRSRNRQGLHALNNRE